MKKIRYENMDSVLVSESWKDLRKWQKERRKKRKDLTYQVPYVNYPKIKLLQKNRQSPTLTWIGHSTFLIQLNGLNIITDPLWAKSLGTYRRLSPPGIAIQDIPSIDAVLISHSHYDHLHYSTIRRLPGQPVYLVPVGLKRWFRRKGKQNVKELKWWERIKIGQVDFTFVPAQHWTRRTLNDTNTSHWGGWMIQGTATPSIYFAGDSGYFRGFSDIGSKFKIDYTLMPIGAYEPEWFMKNQHVNPEEAVQAYLDTKANYMIPMHYGAFRLADDTPKEALDRLENEWVRRNLDRRDLKVLHLGETLKC